MILWLCCWIKYIIAVDKKPFTFTTIESDIGEKLDKMFGVRPSFLKVEKNATHCLLPPQFVFYGMKIRDMEVYEDDVWMVSYPRTGKRLIKLFILLIFKLKYFFFLCE